LEHVRSTAVPGLAAKPVLDFQLSIEDSERRWWCGLVLAAEPAATRSGGCSAQA
jgi:GrpB-like predicted nucleotidyltransferase (UPF0157 family)